jgi:hypothetical protein
MNRSRDDENHVMAEVSTKGVIQYNKLGLSWFGIITIFSISEGQTSLIALRRSLPRL